MKKTASLNANTVATIKSAPKLPAFKAKREYFEFDAYAELARVLLRNGDTIFEGNPANARSHLMPVYREFDAARELFERDELYRTRKTMRQNLLDCWTDQEITRRVAPKRSAC